MPSELSAAYPRSVAASPSRIPIVTPRSLQVIIGKWVRDYVHPGGYFRIDGKPVLHVLNLGDFSDLYGAERFALIIDLCREYARQLGVDPYIVGVVGQIDDATIMLAQRLPLDAVTGYGLLPTWLGPPVQEYADLMDLRVSEWYYAQSQLQIPFYPVVCAGWDASARGARKSSLNGDDGYPYTPVVVGDTVELFEEFLRRARRFNAAHMPRHNVVYLHALNEWTEGSALEPNDRHGYGLLEAVARGGRGQPAEAAAEGVSEDIQ